MAKKAAKKSATRKKSAKKATKPRTAKRVEVPKEHFTDSPFFFVGVILLIMLAVAIVAYYVTMDGEASADGASILATVNGEPITQRDVDFQYNLLPPQYQATMTKDEILEQLINEMLVMQAATEAGIEVTLADVQEQVQGILAESDISMSELNENLAAFNISMEDFENLVRRQLIIQQYAESAVQVEEPTEAELMALYEEQRDSLSVPEQARVRHVLISNQREDAATVAKDIYDRAREGEDFCSLVAENTDDRGSSETCGEYTFPRGMMVPEFEEASFEMEDGEIRMVTTSFGYHIIEKLEQLPEGVQPFSEVEETLRASWIATARAEAYSDMLEQLRSEATIAYGDDAEAPAQENETGTDTTVRIVHTQAEIEECIAERATLYGTQWSGDTAESLAMFSGTAPTYVACDADGAACAEAGVAAYPTWEIDGELHPGRKSLEELSALTGCE